MNHIVPATQRLRSIQSVMRAEAESWRFHGRDLEASTLEDYAQMIEGIRQQAIEEQKQRKGVSND